MTQKLILFGLLSLFVSGAQAHSQHVHVHGAGKLSIAFEGTDGETEFDINAEALLGRERKAKTDAEKLEEANLIKKLQSDWDKMIVFPAANKCKVAKVEAKVDYDVKDNKSHADVEVKADVLCATPLAKGQKIEIKLIENFPKIQKIETQIIVDEIQKSENITSKVHSLQL